MRVLVTGSTSGLGRNAVEYLHQERLMEVRATGRNIKEGQKLIQQGIDFVKADLTTLTDEVAERLFSEVEVVWHCAALSSPWGKYKDFYEANVKATEDLIRYSVKYGVKTFVHISTPSIYFDYQHHLNVEEDYQAKKKVNYYAFTKMIAEQKIKKSAKDNQDISFIILRPRAIFGEYDRVLLPRLISLLKQRKGTLILPREGEVLMDLTYVLNVVKAMEKVTCLPEDKKKNLSGKAYNITNQEPCQLKFALYKLLNEGLGMNLQIKSIPYRILHLLAGGTTLWGNITGKEPLITKFGVGVLNYDMTLSNENAQNDLGYYPEYSLEQAIIRTVKWLKQYGSNNQV